MNNQDSTGLRGLQKFISSIECFRDHYLEQISEIDSTNSELKRRIDEGVCRKFILIADHQTSGRGQFGRSWWDNPHECLLFSFHWDLDHQERDDFPITLLTGVAVWKALRDLTGDEEKIWLKWPNDIMIADSKVGGILVEGFSQGSEILRIVIGIGINLNGKEALLPDGEKRVAVSSFFPKIKILDSFKAILAHWGHLWKFRSEKSALKELCEEAAKPFWKKKVKIWENSSAFFFEGFPEKLTEDGELIIRLNDGSERKINSLNRIKLISP
ncbi:MAG: biotin--[acetyl-CoA-carboxylase] ligase [Candidatus Riflebacteria bacterium]|nr:biotin--[acetyl-CoA-carboxylase] ligase [Candidatus Riflebacteria bacterium]